MAKSRKATAADADLILKLYDLRREPEMRKARNFVFSWMPESADDVVKLAFAYPSQENAWLRQVGGYWEMAASLVLQGALNEDLFFASNNELWFIFSKFSPFLKEIRQKMESPEFCANIEKLATGSKQGRERLARIESNMARWKERTKKAVGKAS